MNKHLHEITAYCQRLNRRHLLLAGSLGLANWALVWALVAAFDAWVDPLRESTSLLLLLLSLPAVATAWIWAFRHYRGLFHLDLSRMARRIETFHPQLNDVLATAADLEEKRRAAPNPLEAHVLASAGSQLRALDWKMHTTHFLERASTVVLTLVLALLMFAGALASIPAKKAIFEVADLVHGTSSGLLVEEFPSEVPVDSDLTVSTRILRWEKTAFIEWEDSRDFYREPVVINAEGKGRFTFYDMQDSLRFRIVTPSLRTDWKDIAVYEPARIDQIEIEVIPPAYTGLPAENLRGLTDLEVVEGASITFSLQSQVADSITLSLGEEAKPLPSAGDQTHEISFPAEDSAPFQFRLEDARGRPSESPVQQLDVIPDRPPVVEILKPLEDATLAPDQVFTLELYAADDFGLAGGRLHLALSGMGEKVISLPLAQGSEDMDSSPVTETELRTGVSLEALGASDGEFLALHVEAEDNRQPEPNLTRSDLLFIEIRTPEPPVEMEGMPMEQEEIDFRELIAEQKRLLRETHRLTFLHSDQRDRRTPELVAALSSLGVEINRLYSDLREDLESGGRNDLASLFEGSLDANEKAVSRLDAGLPGESFIPQSESLSALLKLENAFRNNTRSKEPSEGSSAGGEASSEESSGQEEVQQESATAQLAEARSAMEDLVAGQNRLNSEFERAARTSWSGREAGEAGETQAGLARQVSELDRLLQRIPDGGAVRNPLSEARRQMQSAADRAGQADAEGALRPGLRARESLRFAASELESLLADAAGQELEAAARTAGRLARSQAEAAQTSSDAVDSSASPEELAAMEEEQRRLQDQYETFLEALARRADEMASASPEVTEALRDAADTALQGTTSRNMERAANALLYGQPAMAQPLQDRASDDLEALAGELGQARSRIAGNPLNRARSLGRELGNTLEELAGYAREPEAAPPERLPEIRSQWSSRMEELQQISGDPRFGSLSGQLGRGDGESWEGELAGTRERLQQGARLLQDFLFDEASVSELRINREAAPPPDKYRQMVEAYFRRLANEPAENE